MSLDRVTLDLDACVRDWRGPLTGFFLRRGARLQEADELVADVFARAWLARERFDADGSGNSDARLGAWLAGIARNVEREARRGKRPRALPLEHALDVPATAAPEEPERHEDARVLAALARLPSTERALVGAFYFEDASSARIARLFGLSERAVEGRLRRARERLRAWLRPKSDALSGEPASRRT